MENKSHLTAISRKKISAPMEELTWELDRGRILDYGCGKGFDADEFGLEKFDPHFFPEKPEGKFNVITCNYVLCVVEEKDQQAIIDDIVSMLQPGEGKAYFTVRRDKKNLKGWTKKKTFQRYVELDMDVYYEKKNRFCIYEFTQNEGMIETDVKFTLKIADDENPTDHEFKEGMGKGVLATEVATFRQTPEEASTDIGAYWLAMGIQEHADKFRDRMIEVNFEEVHLDTDKK